MLVMVNDQQQLVLAHGSLIRSDDPVNFINLRVNEPVTARGTLRLGGRTDPHRPVRF